MRLFAAPLLLSAVGAVPAQAQDKPYEGLSVTAITGVEDSSTLGRHQTGVVYGGQIGYDIQSNTLVYGIEGEITGATTKNCFGTGLSTAPNDRLCYKADRDLYAGARVGVVTGVSTLLYGKLGYTNNRQSFEYRDGSTGARNYTGSGTSDGVRVGAGIEKRVGETLTVKAEYRYSDYQPGDKRHQGVVGLGFRF